LTTVAQPTYELGRRAAELLVRRLKGSSSTVPAERVVLDGQLVVRESSGALLVAAAAPQREAAPRRRRSRLA
jgi:DNA-binding LacI/PurR family transcriptional regulator